MSERKQEGESEIPESRKTRTRVTRREVLFYFLGVGSGVVLDGLFNQEGGGDVNSPSPLPTKDSKRRTIKPLPSPTLAQAAVERAEVLKIAELQKFGVNLAGGEFGEVPGRINEDYIYPSAEGDIQRWVDKGITLFRYPVRIERLMENGKPTKDLEMVQGIFDRSAKLGAKIILDPHNFARIKNSGKEERIITTEELSSFWNLMAVTFKSNPAIAAYGLMTEPHDMGTSDWPRMAANAISEIREIDSDTPIIVPGDCWSSADFWTNCNTGLEELASLPLNLAFEAHQYLDTNGSGAYECGNADGCGVSEDLGRQRLSPFVNWCKGFGVQGFVGEIGVPSTDQSWKPVITDSLSYLKENKIGATLWAAGPWWGDYKLSLEKEGAGWLVEEIIKNN